MLQPRLGSMLGGTFIQLIGNNIKFQEGATYTCLFDQTEVEGMYLGEDKVLCISPILRRMGRIKFSLSVSDPLISTQKTILLNDTFFSCKSIIVICKYIHNKLFLVANRGALIPSLPILLMPSAIKCKVPMLIHTVCNHKFN